MKLEELLGAELYKQVKDKIDEVNAKETDKLKHIRYADLSEGEYVSKAKYDSIASEKQNLETQISTLNTTITTLKNGNKDNEELQNTIKTLNADIQKLKDESVNTAKMYALKEQLAKVGVQDPDYIIYKHGGIDKFNFDKENKPIGVEDTIKPYKEDKTMAYLFATQQKPPYDPAGGGTPINNPWSKEHFNLTEQGKLIRENPAQAKELAAAAGITF